jgi:hypothetical protein
MRRIQKISIVGGTVGVLMAGGIAYAAWTSEGTGTGAVEAGSAVNLAIAPAPISGLYPSNTVTQVVKVTNPNPYAVTLSDLTPNNATITSNHAGCFATSVTAATVADTSVLAANGGHTDIPVTVSMDNTANDPCQGATFTISYTAHGQSS